MSNDLQVLQAEIREFAREREWERFHTPKNLAMALAGEVGELLELLQWREDEEVLNASATSPLGLALPQEAADIFIYLLRLADVCGIDLLDATRKKIDLNRSRYPVDLAKGTAQKYTELRSPDE